VGLSSLVYIVIDGGKLHNRKFEDEVKRPRRLHSDKQESLANAKGSAH